MKKTIKKNVQLRLDELIKYVRENKKTLFKECVTISFCFKTKNDKEIIFANDGNFVTSDRIDIDDLFKVEIEEEITEDTDFNTLVSTYIPLGEGNLEDDDIFIDVYSNHSIKDIIETDKIYGVETERIYALIDGKLELIWEREN